jgi:hypothetical protein
MGGNEQSDQMYTTAYKKVIKLAVIKNPPSFSGRGIKNDAQILTYDLQIEN